jgi:hypothetical protein
LLFLLFLLSLFTLLWIVAKSAADNAAIVVATVTGGSGAAQGEAKADE